MEVAFIIYFSFTTKNIYSNSISLSIDCVLITFPLGLLISRLRYFNRKEHIKNDYIKFVYWTSFFGRNMGSNGFEDSNESDGLFCC